jgi:hypothetical protein
MNNRSNKFYGIVEGFFSLPLPIWTPEERLNTFKFIVKYVPNINTYLYCPKNDPYVVEKWNKPYPAIQLQSLQSIVNFSKKNKIRFVFGLNPPLEVFNNNIEKEEWLNKVIKKFDQLKKAGINNFCLLFDDIPFAYDVLENPQSVDGQIIGKTIVTLCNEIYQRFKVDNFWICPPDYCFKKDTQFTRELRLINPEISILWSGNDIFVKTITSSDLLRVKRILGEDKKIIWWDNYPVNDCEQNIGMFNLSGFNPPEKGAGIDGILVNPMRECYANLPFYLTFQSYLQSPKNYNRNKFYGKSLKVLVGSNYKNYDNIIREFSHRNIVDNENKYLLSDFKKTTNEKELFLRIKNIEKDLTLLSDNKITNKFGKLFINTIVSVFNQGDLFIILIKQIMRTNNINKKIFNKLDLFPTTTRTLRYYPEILKIVKNRIKTLDNDLTNQNKLILNKLEKIRMDFETKYKGQQKLKISLADKKSLEQATKKALRFEKELLFSRLTKPSNKLKKIGILSERFNINRFNIS